jgi:proline iminopeptidase
MRAYLLPFLLLAACATPHTPRPSPPPAHTPMAEGEHRAWVDGLYIHYRVHGQGPVCIAHPGGPGLEGAYLRNPGLEQHFTMVYIDPIGTGDSEPLHEGESYTLARDAATIDGVRRELGVAKTCVLGHSYGGFVALTYATAHPDRVSALILYATSPTTGDEWQQAIDANLTWFAGEPWFADAVQGFDAEKKATTDAELGAAFLQQLPLFVADATRVDEYRAFFARFRYSIDPNRRRAADGGFVYDVRAQLGVITAPTLVIAGARDFICSPPFAELMRDGIAGATLVVLDKSGHFGHLEQPEAFADAITIFAARLRTR